MADGDSLTARYGQSFAPGDLLFREGDAGDTMFVLQDGTVRISKTVRGEEQVLAVLGPGEFFGEMAILNGKPRTATAVAETQARALVLGAKTFEQMVMGSPEIAVRLIKRLSRRLDSANELVEVLMHRDPKARVILGLSREASQRRAGPDGSVFVPLDAAALADVVGLAPEQTTEVLTRLRRLGIVRLDEGGIAVTDLSRLDDFLEFLQTRDRGGES